MLRRLSGLRPVFHSEADFQQAFAWEVRTQDPTVRVRLETRPAPGLRLDLLLISKDGQRRTAVELKYLTRLWTGEFAGERFELKDQGAQDIRAHDVVKDIVRVEKFVAAMPAATARSSASAMTRPTGTPRRTVARRTPTRSVSTRARSCTGRERGGR